jgi:phosphodiesterase/alkaline phosphatase D-like protein
MHKRLILMAVLIMTAMLAAAQTSGSKSTSGTQLGTSAISNGPVAEYVADSSAILGWSVHDPSGSMSVKYGTDRDHLNQTAQATASSDGRNYHVHLQGLTPEARYYFQVMQNDQPMGGVGTFRTVASGSAPIKSKATIPE